MSLILQYFHGNMVVLSLLKRRLPFCISSDKVLHINGASSQLCNTLSGAIYVITPKVKRGHAHFIRAAVMLEDQPIGRSTAVRCAVGPAFSGANRLLQQLHTQRSMVHAPFDPPLQSQGAVVLPGYRLFQSRPINCHYCRPDPAKPSRYDRRRPCRYSPMPLPFGPGQPLSTGKTSATKTGPVI